MKKIILILLIITAMGGLLFGFYFYKEEANIILEEDKTPDFIENNIEKESSGFEHLIPNIEKNILEEDIEEVN